MHADCGVIHVMNGAQFAQLKPEPCIRDVTHSSLWKWKWSVVSLWIYHQFYRADCSFCRRQNHIAAQRSILYFISSPANVLRFLCSVNPQKVIIFPQLINTNTNHWFGSISFFHPFTVCKLCKCCKMITCLWMFAFEWPCVHHSISFVTMIKRTIRNALKCSLYSMQFACAFAFSRFFFYHSVLFVCVHCAAEPFAYIQMSICLTHFVTNCRVGDSHLKILHSEERIQKTINISISMVILSSNERKLATKITNAVCNDRPKGNTHAHAHSTHSCIGPIISVHSHICKFYSTQFIFECVYV